MKEPGRIKLKLADVILRDTGIVVDPYDLWTQQGAYRSRYWDLARWGGDGAKFAPEEAEKFGMTHKFSICSWDTMSECAKYGITIVGDPRRDRITIELCRKEEK